MPLEHQIARASLVNATTAEILQFSFNPQQLNAQVTANYGKAAALGGTGQRFHFGFTSNFTFGFDIYMDRAALEMRNEGKEGTVDTLMQDTQKFLLSLVFPVGKQNDPIRRSPPRVLFLWPGLIEMPVRMMSESFQFQKFTPSLSPWIYRVPVQMESDLVGERITSAVIRTRGFQLAGYGS